MDTRTRILDAAAALLAQKQLTMAAVARQAQVSRSEVYRRFQNKQGLLDALVEAGRISTEEGVAVPARERILDALASLLAEGGLAAATVDAIAQRANVGQVTVYRTFGERDGLLRAFLDERTPRRQFQARIGDLCIDDILQRGDPSAFLVDFAHTILFFSRSIGTFCG